MIKYCHFFINHNDFTNNVFGLKIQLNFENFRRKKCTAISIKYMI